MAGRIKARVKTSMARGLRSKRYADRGARRGEQGKPRHPGYSGGKRKKAIASNVSKSAYAKRIKSK